MSQQETDRSDRDHQHYLDAEAQGRAVAAAWIGHPSTKPIILRYRQAAQSILDTPPVDRFMINQKSVTQFTLVAIKTGARNSRGDIEPPVLHPVQGWPMTPQERAQARCIADDWAAFLVLVASKLRQAEVKIDTQYTAADGDRRYSGDLVALGELLALPIDLDIDAQVLVDRVINTVPPMQFAIDDLQPSIRHIRPVATDRTVMAIQRGMVEAATGATTFPERRTPKQPDAAAATEGSQSRLMQIRRRAILKVSQREGLPPQKLKAADLHRQWVSTKGSMPGSMIRLAMEEELNHGQPAGAPPKTVSRPSARTLRRDLQVLGILDQSDETSSE